MGLSEIGLGSMVVQKSGEGPVMVVAAATGDDMFCVSLDLSRSIKEWRHRSALKAAERPRGKAA